MSHLTRTAAAEAARCRTRGAPLAHPDRFTWHRDFRHGLNGHGWGPQVSFTRASSALFQDSGGTWRVAASNAARIRSDRGLLVEEQRTNKCTNHNANPDVSLTNMTLGGNTSATLTRVTDATELAAAGLDMEVCTSGYVFKLDNNLGGAGAAWAIPTGSTGNTNKHAVQAWVRGSGTIQVRLVNVATSDTVLTGSYQRVKQENITPASTGDRLMVFANYGATVFFALNQLEEGQSATSPIVTSGASAIRYGDTPKVGYPGVMADECSIVTELYREITFFSGNYWYFTCIGDTASDYLLSGLHPGTAKFRLTANSGGVSQVDLSATTGMNANTWYKAGVSARKDDFRLFVGGLEEAVDASGGMPANAPADIETGHAYTGANQGNCWIRSVTIYPDALPPAQMEVLTA